jgi:4'-phosphopantetheinyl transferase
LAVWEIDLEGDAAGGASDREVLDATERARAERFRFQAHRRRFVAAHAGLRRVLAQYLETRPEDLIFRQEPGGKPRLDGPFARCGLSFSLTHSASRGLVAVCREREVGIDTERMAAGLPIEEIAEGFLTARERRQIAGLSGPALRERLFRLWVRKEAVLKAAGCGLALPATAVYVGACPRPTPGVVQVRGWSGGPDRVGVSDLPAPECWVSAVAWALSG